VQKLSPAKLHGITQYALAACPNLAPSSGVAFVAARPGPPPFSPILGGRVKYAEFTRQKDESKFISNALIRLA